MKLFLFFIFITFVLLQNAGPTVANQGLRLKSFIQSRMSVGERGADTWTDINEMVDADTPIYVGPQDGLMEADKIEQLPGQPMGSEFDQYGGYVTVDPTAGRALFYYFAEAPEPDNKPLVLWLNGGPGCSSLGTGAFQELGPFYVKSDGKTLYKNQYAWNNVANMIFLETPAGVGYSYSNTTSDYSKTGDRLTTEDSYTFLVNWLERFPHYKGRDFFITGESYGGHYIPNLASAIIARNKAPNASIINLKGIAIGNGLLDYNTTQKGTCEFLWNHAMISREAYQAAMGNCSFKDENYSQSCLHAISTVDFDYTGIDNYNIYAPTCSNVPEASKINSPIVASDPCSELYIASYLNRPEVQKALHANTTGLNYTWIDCSNFFGVFTGWNDAPATMLPTIKHIIASNISVWLYSGDLDSVVPFTATQYWLDMLNLPIKTPRRQWFSKNSYEVNGFVIGYEGLVYLTVRGAGHMVPENQPERALTLFSSFLQGKLPYLYGDQFEFR